MYSKTLIIGNVGRDAELSYTPTGLAVAKFTVAVNKVTGKGDTRKESTTWYRVTVWRELAESVAPYIKKGITIFVEGEIGLNAYTNKKGEAAASLELTAYTIKLLSRASGNNNAASEEPFDSGSEESSDIPF